MALFEKLKQLISYEKRREVERDLAVPCSAPPSFGGKPGIPEPEKLERTATLTPREYKLYLLLLEGFTLKESANRLCVKYSTVNTHMSSIYRKLGVNSRAELIINYRYMTQPGTATREKAQT